MKFTIKKQVMKDVVKKVDVDLKIFGCEIILTVDGWEVFRINPDGTGTLLKYIGESSGLQLDKDERIIIVPEN